ncbi:MAG: DUF4143 domain-containing protein [Pseudonocardiales bacterium]
MTPRDQQRFQTVAQRIVTAIADVRGRAYTPQTGFGLYGTTGTHSNYAYARHIADPNTRKTYGYTFETGPWVGNARDSFHPADPEPIKLDAKSGLLALTQQCICAIELIGVVFLGGEQAVDALRRIRDDVLATTPAGRDWILLFEDLQTRVLPVVLADDALAERVASVVSRASRAAADETASIEPELVVSRLGPRLYHLRTENGRHEVDLVIELADRRVIGIEIKAATVPNHTDGKHLAWLRDSLGDRFVTGLVLHTGPYSYPLDKQLYATPICALWSL